MQRECGQKEAGRLVRASSNRERMVPYTRVTASETEGAGQTRKARCRGSFPTSAALLRGSPHGTLRSQRNGWVEGSLGPSASPAAAFRPQ